MASLELPKRLTLDELPINPKVQARNGRVLPGIEITIDDKIRDVIESIKKSTVTHVSLGKRPAFVLDNRDTYNFLPKRRERCYLYRGDRGTVDADEGSISLAGVLNLQQHVVTKAKPILNDKLDLNDPGVQSLQRSLAEHEQRKQANTTVFVQDSSQLPPAKSGRQAIKAQKMTKANAKHKGMLMPHRQGLFNQSASRSTPTSPSLMGMTPPPTAAKVDVKQEALKLPLIHLLAVRPVSESFITKTLNCSSSDIKFLLEKFGQPTRLNPDKHELSNRGYKDLDVWKFPYKDQEDREAAISNAISAFDRQRITPSDGAWQMLLPKEKRGKGITLSRLKLHTDAPARGTTPKIHVESTSESRPNNKARPQHSDEQFGHLSPNNATGGLSDSQMAPKKNKISEREAQAKRLLSKNPKKQSAAAIPKPTTASPSVGPKKETTKKVPQPAAGKIKSAEFVEDSDSDELPDFDHPPPKSTTARPEKTARPVKKDIVRKPEQPEKSAPPAKAPVVVKKSVTAATASSTASTKNNNADIPKAAPMSRQVSHTRKDSSPIKPSPLGSSPPTNASDLDNDVAFKSSKSSSSSNSPLMNQRRETLQGFKKAPGNGIKPQAAAVSPDKTLKRKASELEVSARIDGSGSREVSGDERVKRRQSSSQGSVTSNSGGRAGSNGPQGISKEDIASSLKFKQMHMKYAQSLSELKQDPNPPSEKVEKLKRMYLKLSEHKAQLWGLTAR